MNADRHFNAICELWAALCFVANALFYQYLVRFCVWAFASKPLRPSAIMKMRIAGAVFAVVLACKGLYDLNQS